MNSVLVVANEKAAQGLEALLRTQYPDARISAATNGSHARRMLAGADWELLVVSAPLADENGVELAAQAAAGGGCGVLLLVKSDHADAISQQVEAYGVFVVEKPIHKPFFFRALRLLHASRSRVRGLQKEKAKLQDKIEEIRLVDRAKCALIQYLGLTEPQAHRYIEKQAMDMRATKRDIAMGILKTYEV